MSLVASESKTVQQGASRSGPPAAGERSGLSRSVAGRVLGRLARSYAELAGKREVPVFRLTLDDASVHEFGSGDPAFEVMIRTPAGRAALASLDETRFALAVMAGDVDVEGELLQVFALRPLMTDRHPLQELWSKVLHPLVYGQAKSDAKWVAEHYDVNSDFYLLFLDQRRCYSHGIFERDDEALDDAILRKLDFALDATGIQPGQRLLDIGAGWGSMTEHAGARGIKTTSLTISSPSEDYVNAIIAEQNLPCRVLKEHFLEYRPAAGEEDSGPPYDAIVNLGVTEHLPDYAGTLQQYWRLLKPGGKVYLDACASRKKFPFNSFTYRFIFPGNASPLCLHEYLEEVAKTEFELVGVYNDRQSYLLTTQRWAENLERHRDEIEERWGRSLFRRFQIYLWGCVDVFSRDQMGAYRWVLQKPA